MSTDECHFTLRDNTMEKEGIKRTVVSVNVPDYYMYQREELGKEANSKVSDNTIFSDLKVKISVVSVCHSNHKGVLLLPISRPVQTCSFEDTPKPSPSTHCNLSKLVHYVAHTSMGKRVVDLQLKCLLVR